jgi:pimeloyl-ACP methyl ester carboxylesterase
VNAMTASPTMPLSPASSPSSPVAASDETPAAARTSPAAWPQVPLHTRRHGAGDAVVLLHTSTGYGRHWAPLVSLLAKDAVAVVAPDLHGHGRSAALPPWMLHHSLRADAQAAWVALGPDSHNAHLVGHAWGAAVALQMALLQPQRVSSLTLYEPVAFGLLAEHAGSASAWVSAVGLAESVASAMDVGQIETAARLFMDFWSGPGSFAGLSPARQQRLCSRMPTVCGHFESLFAARWSERELARLRMPVWLAHGAHTRRVTAATTQRLKTLLPDAQGPCIAGASHLAPVCEPALVLPLMAQALRRHIAHAKARQTAPQAAGVASSSARQALAHLPSWMLPARRALQARAGLMTA